MDKKLHTLQGGFRKEGSFRTETYNKIISEEAKKNNQPIFAILLDIKKADDTAWRDSILHKLKTQFNIKTETLRIVKKRLTNTQSGLRSDFNVTNLFNTTPGVVQGSVISPTPYAVFMSDLITELDKSGLGVTVLNYHAPSSLHCDDVILTTNNDENLIQLLELCKRHGHIWHYRFNTDKCRMHVHNYNHNFKQIINTQCD